MGDPGWALVGTVVVFALFLQVKSRVGIGGRQRGNREGRARIAAIKKEIFSHKRDPEKRALLWRRAAQIALEDLGRPYRAATYARRADKLDPDAKEAVPLIAKAFRRARRYRSLERLLWRRLDRSESWTGEVSAATISELIALYRGPLRRPAQARALERLWAQDNKQNPDEA